MLSVILTILKVLGCILLALFIVALVLILLLLFVPVRYCGRGCYEETPEAEVSVSWLLRLVRFHLNYRDGIRADARVGFLKVWSMEPQTSENVREEDAAEMLPFTEEEIPESAFPEKESSADSGNSSVEESISGGPESSGENMSGTLESGSDDMKAGIYGEAVVPAATGEQEEKKKKQKSRQKKASKPYTGTPETWDEKLEKIVDRVYEVKDQIDEGIAFLKEESTQRLISLLKNRVLRILKEICPTDYGGKLRFGFDDPFTTGQICSAAALLYPVYRERIQVEPLFDRTEMAADLSVKGRVRLFVPVWSAARIWFSRDFQKVFKRFRNRKKDNGG